MDSYCTLRHDVAQILRLSAFDKWTLLSRVPASEELAYNQKQN
jgi:hypothetical protein